MACYWKVRVWDGAGQASQWSAPAMWSMGLLDQSEWRAQWISDPNSAIDAATQARVLQAAHFGYRSYYSPSQDSEKWVAIDLGGVHSVDAVRLYAVTDPWQPGTPARFFPLRFQIEAATAADFSNARAIVDRTATDEPAPGSQGVLYRFPA